MAKESHIIKAGLVHGKYYKVYVTQVNSAGLESAKSAPVLIRVGDVTGPPAPALSLDTAYGNGGYLKNKGTVNVGLKWTRPDCDDLDYYVVHHWHTFDWYTADGEYTAASGSTQAWVSGDALEYVLASQKNAKEICVGLQAVDISNNVSPISVIKITPEDLSILDTPTNPITVVAGVWQITVYTVCPVSTEIAAVLWYRDNTTLIGTVPAYSNQPAIIVDQLSVEIGLEHYYTYCYVDSNGNYSPRSAASETVTARTIDTTVIDRVSLEALLDAWNSTNVEDIDALKADLLTQSQTIAGLANQLTGVTRDYYEIYNNYTVLANKIELLSASVSSLDGTTSNLQTSYSQLSNEIQLRAVKIDVDNALGSVAAANVAAINVQADRITNIVSNLNNNAVAYSSIAQLANAIQLKVSKDGIVAAINISPETIQIDSKYLHITGDALVDGSIRASKLYLDDIFPQNNSTNGYLKFPGGVWMQWGVFYMVSPVPGHPSVAQDSQYFSVRFPNRCYGVHLTMMGGSSPSWLPCHHLVTSFSSAGFTWTLNTGDEARPFSGNPPVFYLAFGC